MDLIIICFAFKTLKKKNFTERGRNSPMPKNRDPEKYDELLRSSRQLLSQRFYDWHQLRMLYIFPGKGFRNLLRDKNNLLISYSEAKDSFTTWESGFPEKWRIDDREYRKNQALRMLFLLSNGTDFYNYTLFYLLMKF